MPSLIIRVRRVLGFIPSSFAAPRGPSMRSLMQALGDVELEVEDGRQFANVNTPADWTACAS